MPLDPETGLIMFIVGGIGAVASFSAFKFAEDIGPYFEVKDLLPMPPPYPPLPRFLYTKPEAIKAVLKGR